MIAIDNILVSDEIVHEQFVCDLNKCKGGCCVDGDAGAPLENEELAKINEVYDAVLEAQASAVAAIRPRSFSGGIYGRRSASNRRLLVLSGPFPNHAVGQLTPGSKSMDS